MWFELYWIAEMFEQYTWEILMHMLYSLFKTFEYFINTVTMLKSRNKV